ncbi:MAG: hypothetical protein QF864_11410 [SAR202 cluster bacterium]|nr:hypothetical protein [SAR202 cluster bacterium]
MAETASFEGAQALFCAIADFVGTAKMHQEFLGGRALHPNSLKKYPTYEEFKKLKKNQVIIDKAFKKTKLVGVSRKQIETLLEDKLWYESSVLIAIKLLDDIKDINTNFGKIQAPNWQDLFYVRGAKGGNTTMDNISILFKYANKNDKKFGDINKWSPADIYFVSKDAKKEVQEQVKIAKDNKSYTFLQLNNLCSGLIDSGDLLPLSLKKVENRAPHIDHINFNRPLEEKKLKKMKYTKTKKSKTGRNIQIHFTPGTSQLKIRHVPSNDNFFATKTIKAEIQVTGYPRLGSIGSMDILLSVIRDAKTKSGNVFAENLKAAFDKGFKSYKKGIEELNVYYDIKANDGHSILEGYQSNKGLKDMYEDYKQDREKISKEEISDNINPVIEDYFDTNKTPKTTKSFSDSTMMIQSFIKYASSRSPQSGKFVIAK